MTVPEVIEKVFADHDYVYHGVATRDAETGVVTLNMNSIEHPDAPETVGVITISPSTRTTATR